jgi:hypothetical protein
LATKSPLSLASEKYASGGGILILADLRPDEEAEFIEFEPAIEPQPAEPATVPMGNGHAIGSLPVGPHIALDESAPEADPPESFEVCSYPYLVRDIDQLILLRSIHSITTTKIWDEFHICILDHSSRWLSRRC